MNAQVARWLETIRQRALTKRLGQVVCTHSLHDLTVRLGGSCR